MILSFKQQFVHLILSGQKIHTIRTDEKCRWKPGADMHMATGVRTRAYNNFKTAICHSVQKIEIHWKEGPPPGSEQTFFQWLKSCNGPHPVIYIDGKECTHRIHDLAVNDGFKDAESFLQWPYWNNINYSGKILHWTPFKY